jgi:hypothetical protein
MGVAEGWGTEDATRPGQALRRRLFSLAVVAVAGGLMLVPPAVALLVLLGLVG